MSDTPKFSRTIEHFTCAQCGSAVQGNGYTNHCPACLWSRHVDINPGDRAAECKGMMQPIGIEQKAGKYIILHRCVVCGFERRNKSQAEDDFEMLLKLSAQGRP